MIGWAASIVMETRVVYPSADHASYHVTMLATPVLPPCGVLHTEYLKYTLVHNDSHLYLMNKRLFSKWKDVFSTERVDTYSFHGMGVFFISRTTLMRWKVCVVSVECLVLPALIRRIWVVCRHFHFFVPINIRSEKTPVVLIRSLKVEKNTENIRNFILT